MKDTLRFLLWIMMVCFWSCSSESEDIPEPTPKPDSNKIEISGSVPTMEQKGSTATITFTTNAAWTASVSSSTSWLKVSPTSGVAGTHTLTFTTAENDTYDERNAAVTIQAGSVSKNITITQKQKDALIVTSNKVEMGAEGGDFTIEAKANVSLTYEIEEAAKEWITTGESRALTTKILNFQTKANGQKEARQGNIVLKGGDGLTETVTIYQEGEKPTLVITSDDVIVDSNGENLKIELKSNVDYTMVMPEVDWISKNESRSISAYTHYLLVFPNESYEQRNAHVFFMNETEGLRDSISITQLQNNAIIVAKNEYTIASGGSDLNFSVHTNVDFEVSVTADWIKQNIDSRALVEKTLSFVIAENENEDSREGEIVVAFNNLKQTIKVKQMGTTDYETIERSVLMEFYKATGGDNWNDNTNWGTDRPLNEWKGITLNVEGRVKQISLNNNNLTGYIPSEIGNLKALDGIELQGNNLSGNIPSEIGNLKELYWLNISYNKLSGNIPSEICNLTRLFRIYLSNNELTGEIPPKLDNLTGLYVLDLSHNQLSGTIPEEIGELNSMLLYVDLSYNNLSGGIPANLVLTSATTMMLGHNRLNGYIPDAVAFSYIWKYVWNLEENLQQQAGFELTYSDSQGYSRDCELLRLQQHTKGNGIKVVISGDGYTESMIEDGTYETAMREAMEGFFSKEPFTTYRDYFDIYAYFAVSADEGIGGNTAFKTRYRENDRYVLMDDDLCIKRFSAAFSEIGYDLSDVTAIVVLNDEETLGTYNCSWNSDGFSLSNTNKNALFSVLVHEANGHGFGFLADEYVTDEMTASPASFKEDHDQGKWLNVDGINDPEKIGWAYFLKDERYTSEKIGIYEGACLVRKGRFRATEMSMMNSADKDNFFNAPSRWGIYQRIMKLAGEDYSFEDFLEYDAVNRAMYDELEKTGRSVKGAHEKMNGVKNGPPVYKDYPTSEILLKNDRLIRSANR